MQGSAGEQGHERTAGRETGLDPVCGMTVPLTSRYRHAIDGREYVFCSAGCRDRFAADPAKFIQGSPRPMESDASPAAAYTCPMHPEIRAGQPGSCSKCGMALETRAQLVPARRAEPLDLEPRVPIIADLRFHHALVWQHLRPLRQGELGGRRT